MQRRFLGKYDGKKYDWFIQIRELIIFLVIVFLIFHIVVGVSKVTGESMQPTLNDNDVVLYLRLGSNYDYGDIVYVKMPSGERYVKRVVALGGDVVDIRDGHLYVNDIEESGAYVNGSTEQQESDVTYPYTVAEGRVFVLGDNREVSVDSRTFGSVMNTQIKGKLILYKNRIKSISAE